VSRGAYRLATVSRRTDLLAVFAGGCAGALARVGLAEAWPADAGSWPWATLLANVAGALVLGLLVARGRDTPLLGAGFCGALTTFSTLQLELVDLPLATAIAYALVTLAAGYGAAVVAQR
jgi:CrcB protein